MNAADAIPAPKALRRTAGRKRRWAGWVVLVLGLLITGVWMASGWWKLGRFIDSSSVVLWKGTLSMRTSFLEFPPGTSRWTSELNDDPEWNWIAPTPVIRAVQTDLPPDDYCINLGVVSYGTGYINQVFTLALWPPAALLLFSGGVFLWSAVKARRRAMTGVCLECGYSLAGLAPGGPCPECGP